MTSNLGPAPLLDALAVNVLALNVGSASLKAASYSLSAVTANDGPVALATARISLDVGAAPAAFPEAIADELLSHLVADFPVLGDCPSAVLHRIVHGGDRPRPLQLTPLIVRELEDLATWAPLHQPPALALVAAARKRWPAAKQIGVFDTSWHQTIAEKHRLFALPHALYVSGVKRYGFHGLAFQSAMQQLAQLQPALANDRVVLAHLGGGSSLCAVLQGRSINTTMGMTPLGGLPMATRSGSLDPGVLLHLQRELALSPPEIDQLLWRESGLLGLSAESGDMRTLLNSNSEGARRAIDVFVAGVVEAIAAMAASTQGIDALVFSGGIGSHATAIRARVAAGLAWLGIHIDPQLNSLGGFEISAAVSPVRTFVVAVDEEREMLRSVLLCSGMADSGSTQ